MFWLYNIKQRRSGYDMLSGINSKQIVGLYQCLFAVNDSTDFVQAYVDQQLAYGKFLRLLDFSQVRL
jgi:hypothetical protein